MNMKFGRYLAQKNIRKKPVRTAALIILTAFLALSVFAGSIIVMSLQNGLKSYEARLGADIVVVPNEARTKGKFDSILLQGIPGYFYMDSEKLDKIRNIDGVEVAAPQFYLASTSAGCCSVPVQIIGFDPETDFSIQPWIRQNYSGTLSDGDIMVGYDISIPTDFKLKFYDTECNVVAQFDQTGTGLDSAVYANMNTIRQMMRNAKKLGFDYFDGTDVDKAVSSVMVKVEDGYSIEKVCGDINTYVRKVDATSSGNLITNISTGLEKVSGFTLVLVILIWILAIVILIIAFFMISNERTKEFAVLRTVGASKGMISSLLKTESLIISVVGSIIGVLIGTIIILAFGGLISSSLDMPYLIPNAGVVAAIALGSVVISVIASYLASAVASKRVTKNETGLILRDSV